MPVKQPTPPPERNAIAEIPVIERHVLQCAVAWRKSEREQPELSGVTLDQLRLALDYLAMLKNPPADFLTLLTMHATSPPPPRKR